MVCEFGLVCVCVGLCTNTVCLSSSPSSVVLLLLLMCCQVLAGVVTLSRCYCSVGKQRNKVGHDRRELRFVYSFPVAFDLDDSFLVEILFKVSDCCCLVWL